MRTINKDQIRSFKTNVRPEHKNNTILEIKLDNKIFWCERPLYNFTKFDQSLCYANSKDEGKWLFNTETILFFDQLGRAWFQEELTSKYLLNFYLKNPVMYLNFAAKRVNDIKKVISLMKEVNKTVYSDNKETIIANLKKMKLCYDIFYSHMGSIFWVFDDIVHKFKETLLKFLDKAEANTYLCEFLTAEITKEALKLGVVEEYDNTDRGSSYGSDKPIIFHREPKIFVESKLDAQIFSKAASAPEEVRKNFFALRLIMPAALQINEEAQYIESKMLSGHIKVIMKKVCKLLNKTKQEIDNMTYKEVIEELK